MASVMNDEGSSAAVLVLETRQRAMGTKTTTATTANADAGVGDPPASFISLGGARFHQHLPPSYQQSLQAREQHQQAKRPQPQPPCPGETAAGAPARKTSSSSLNQVHEHSAPTSASAAAPALCAAVASSDVVDDIRKCGYMRKQKHGHKRFFVLRGTSHLGPSRLEYYDSEKKFRNSLRFAAGGASAAVASCSPKRIIYLYQCFTVNKRADSKHKYLIALYTKDDYFAIVAENEREQEDWYQALSDLMNESKRSQVDADEFDDLYSALSPVTVFKEVWQVNVKPKGLGQTKNLTGVYRLCLSSKTLHLVKLNSETPCVTLQLMNIRRCGHSESFFFIEVGRSSSTGPGEIWMQVEDSVVAQSVHETILETMKALKAFADFRPRSKSQSSGSNPAAFVTTRRHLGNLPPSQTGLRRRSRTESAAGTPSSCKGASAYRFRTSSEGEGTMSRPYTSTTGSLLHLNTCRGSLGRQECAGRYSRAPSSSSYHTRSASLPVSHFSCAASPVSVSSSSGHGSASETLTRPSSASLCGSPSDGGFNSSDECGSSPGDLRYVRVHSGTPESLGDTPPIREESCLNDYVAMVRHRDIWGGPDTSKEETCEEKSLWKRTFSSTRPAGGSGPITVYQKMTQTSSSLDDSEAGPLNSPQGSNGHANCLGLGSGSYSEQYRQGKPSLCTDQHRNPTRDDSYMSVMPGVGPLREDSYMSMQPSLRHPASSQGQNTELASPQQVDTQGYMMVIRGDAERLQVGEYMDMGHCHTHTPPESPRPCSPYFSLPRSYKAPVRESRHRDEYVPMSSPAKLAHPAAERGLGSPSSAVPVAHMCAGISRPDVRAARPSQLPLDQHHFSSPRSEKETRAPSSSPAEYMNIEFGGNLTDGSVFSPCSGTDNYVTLEAQSRLLKAHCPRPSLVAPWNPPSYIRPHATTHSVQGDNYVDVGLGAAVRSPCGMLRHLCAMGRVEGRSRHSSDTGASAAPASLHQLRDPKWLGSASFDAVWMHVEGATSSGAALPVPARVTCSPGDGVCRRSSGGRHKDLNYIALDLREDSWLVGDQSPVTPPTPPAPLSENGTYASLDFSKADRLRSTSQD